MRHHLELDEIYDMFVFNSVRIDCYIIYQIS